MLEHLAIVSAEVTKPDESRKIAFSRLQLRNQILLRHGNAVRHPRKAGGLMSWTASKAVGLWV